MRGASNSTQTFGAREHLEDDREGGCATGRSPGQSNFRSRNVNGSAPRHSGIAVSSDGPVLAASALAGIKSFCAAACDDGSLTMDVGVASRKRHGPGKGSNAGNAEANQENRRRDLNSPSRTIPRFAVNNANSAPTPGRADPLGYSPFRADSIAGAAR